MEIKAISSGSKGNAYYVSDGKTRLLIECGVTISKLKRTTEFDLEKIHGIIISHRHSDHCRSVKQCSEAGIDLFAPSDVFEYYGLCGTNCHRVREFRGFTAGTMFILPFDLNHDCVNFGYLICSRETKERLLYFSDTYMVKYRFEHLTHIMAECNHSMRLLKENTEAGLIPVWLKDRIKVNHMSIENLLKFFKANDMSEVKEIYLIHISENNGNPASFRQRVRKASGKPVKVFK